MLIKELCVENLAGLTDLQTKQVARVELCDNLAVGGTTPSYGIIKEAVQLLHDKGIEVATMIRPRGGDFVYHELELQVMETDIEQAIKLGSDYLVLGLLTADKQLDKQGIERLLPTTQGLPIVFHMAFDQIPKDKQFEALDQLVNYGFVRLLVHGSADSRPITDNIEHLRALVSYAKGKIDLMIGGGVTANNCHSLADKIGTTSVHGTKII